MQYDLLYAPDLTARRCSWVGMGDIIDLSTLPGIHGTPSYGGVLLVPVVYLSIHVRAYTHHIVHMYVRIAHIAAEVHYPTHACLGRQRCSL